MAKQCELCGKNHATDMLFGVNMCQSCSDHSHKAIIGDLDELRYFLSPGAFPNPTAQAQEKLIKHFAKKYDKLTSGHDLEKLDAQGKADAEKRIEENKKRIEEEKERNKKLHEDRLNSLRYRGYEGYYEYKTVIINDGTLGGVSSYEITSTLNDLALDGWRLVSSYANELGHNSKPGSVLSAGTNATIDEHIFILERFIKL